MKNFFQFSGNTLSIGNASFTFSLGGVIEIIIFAVVIYYVMVWIKRTKAWDLLKGAGILAAVYLLAKLLKLNSIAYLFEKSVGYLIFAAIVIFQPELRKALGKLGTRKYLPTLFHTEMNSTGLSSASVDAIVRALAALSANKTGALIVIERSIILTEYIETGIELDAVITSALLEQIFEHNTPLHDGAAIIRGNRVVSATAYLPLSDNMNVSKDLGTRHRAGIGISEVSDCISLIASEETGSVSVAVDGQLYFGLTDDELRDILSDSRFETSSETSGSEPDKKTARKSYTRKERRSHER